MVFVSCHCLFAVVSDAPVPSILLVYYRSTSEGLLPGASDLIPSTPLLGYIVIPITVKML